MLGADDLIISALALDAGAEAQEKTKTGSWRVQR